MPTFSAEQILFANHVTGGAYLLSAVDGSVLSTIPGPIANFPDSIYGTASPTVLAGHGALDGSDPAGDALQLFDYSFAEIASVQWGADTLGHGHTLPVAVDEAGQFYIGNDARLGSGGAKVRRYSAAGVQLDEWTLPYVTLNGMAVSRDGSVLYYAEDSESLSGTAPVQSALHRYDLTGDAPLADLIAGGGDSRWGIDWFMSVDDELFATWSPNRFPAGDAENWIVRRIDRTTGDILRTYAAPNPPFDGFDVSIRPDLTDDSAFWMWTDNDFGSPSLVTLTKFDIATGAVLRQFDLDNDTLQGRDTWWVQSTRDTEIAHPDGTIGPYAWVHVRTREGIVT